MKILKIRFENINSLKGVHEIDFSSEPWLLQGCSQLPELPEQEKPPYSM